MAERRMFAKSIIDSDAFLEMPATTQMLYFHLAMRADDDGFVNNPKRIQRMVGASDDDMKVLFAKRFLIGFESGVVVIKHWRIHNYIQKDRYKETSYLEEKAQIVLKDNGSYTEAALGDTECIQDGYSLDTQVRLGKDRLGNTKRECERESEADARHSHGEYGWVKLTDSQYDKLLSDLGEAELKRCVAYVDESAQSNGNKNKWKDWNLVIRKCSKQRWGIKQEPVRTDWDHFDWGRGDDE